ncbi:MAG: prepilin-type N-terminal cleavage/methylation domain-containing protein [Leptolyngbyaceae cyanobacterium]
MISSKASPKYSSSAGFTLVELLVVVVIVGVLGAIAAPSWLAYATRQRMKAVESDLVQVFNQARETAVVQRRDVDVQIDETADVPTVAVDGDVQELGPNELRPGMVTLDVASGAADTVTFDYQGTARNNAGGDIPFVVDILPSTGNRQNCVAVATLLGNVKTANSVGECDAF